MACGWRSIRSTNPRRLQPERVLLGVSTGFNPCHPLRSRMEDRSILQSALDSARKQGAKAAEVLRETYESKAISGARVRPSRGGGTRNRVRVWIDGVRTGVGESPMLEAAISMAIANANAAPIDPHAGPADRFAPLSGPLGIDDRRHLGIVEADRNEVLQLAERSLSVGSTRLERIEYTETRVVRSLLSSRDVSLEAGSTTYTLGATASLSGVALSHRIASRHFSDVVSLPFGTELRRRLEGLTLPRVVPAAGSPVVIEPRAMASLIRSIAPAFTASAVQSGSFVSPLLGKRLAPASLHVTDDAGLSSGLYTLPFDACGVPPMAIALLKEGVVNSLYHDVESARAAGLRPTGHVRWDGRLAPSNLIVRPGSRTRNVILTELKDYVLVDELPSVNVQTGRVGGPVWAQVFQGGQAVGSFQGAVSTGVVELLNCIAELAADQERNEEVDAPTTVFAGLSIGG